MLPLSLKSRAEEGSTRKQKRSRAAASHPRPNLRAPHLSSCPGLHPYDSHSPSHRPPSSTTQARFWRASGASRLSARSPGTQGFSSTFRTNQAHHSVQGHLNSFNCTKCLKQIFAPTPFFGHQTRHHASSSRVCYTSGATAPPLPPPCPPLFLPPPLRISADSLGRTPVLSPVRLCYEDRGLLASRDARSVRDEHR